MKRCIPTTALSKLLAGVAFAIIVGSIDAYVAGNVAHAAEAAQLEEVVVTARRRQELEQDVPIATTVFTESTIESAGIVRPEDFIALTSNVQIVDTANAGDTQVTIRGITSTRDAEGTFAYVVDGVLITNPNGFNQELFDIQSIEVLKGPQGALYGRNAVSGAIIVTTRAPGDEFEGTFRASGGSDGYQKGAVSLSGPISDTLRGSLSVVYRDEDGEYENDFQGKDDVVDFAEEQSARARLIWEATDALTLDAVLSRRDVDGGAINFNAVFALPDAAAAFGDPTLFKDVNDHDFNFNFNVPGENEQENTFFSLKADYEMSWATLTASYSYDDLEEHLLSDGTSAAFGLYSFDFGGAPNLNGPTVGDAQNACSNTYQTLSASGLYAPGNNAPFFAFPGPVPGVAVDLGIAPLYGLNALLPPYTPSSCDGYQYQERNQESSSFELRLTGETESSTWMAGVYYTTIEREVVVSYGADLGDGFFGRTPFVDGRTDLLFSDEFETDAYAVYGQYEFDITDNQTLTLSGRYDSEDREVSNKVPNVASAAAFGGGAPINPAYDGSFTDVIPDRDEDFSQFQPKVSWRWAFSDDASVYASYGVGFRSGGFNNIGSAALVDAAYATIPTRPANLRDEYDKEVSEAFEVGLKSEWFDRRLRVNAAVFRTDVEDSQFFNFLAGGFGILRVVTNIDEVEITGFEIDVTAVLTPNLTAIASYGMTDSEIKKNVNRPYTKGNDAPLTPENTANLGLDWSSMISDNLRFNARLDWRYVGETWFSTVQDNVTLNAFSNVSDTYRLIGLVFGDATQTPPGPGIPADGIIAFGTSDYSKGKRDAYDTLNLRLGLESENWSITAWGRNITGEEYLEEVIPAPEFGGYFVHPSRTESYGVDFTLRF
jgi:iron complex outermembrane receptor protein